MNNTMIADPDLEVSAMCHRNHVDRAPLYERGVMDAEYEPVAAKSGPVIHIFDRQQEIQTADEPKAPSIGKVRKILGALARGGVGLVFLCGMADGLINTTYGLMLTICCIGWGLLHLLQWVAHG